MDLELDAIGDMGTDLLQGDGCLLAADHGDDLGSLCEALDRRRQGRAGAAPGDDLLADEADRVAPPEAPGSVVAGRWGDAAGRDRLQGRR